MASAQAPVLEPRSRIPGGCCKARVEPDLSAGDAANLAARFKALGDPTRLQIVSVLRRAAPQAICQCELTPLFEISQQALSRHMKVLRAAGLVASERRGVWTYYFIEPGTLEETTAWIS